MKGIKRMKRGLQCDAPKTPDLAAAAAAGTWAVRDRREPRDPLMAQAAFVGDSPPTIAPGNAGPQVRRMRTSMSFTSFTVSALLWPLTKQCIESLGHWRGRGFIAIRTVGRRQ
jgi:hypothetical protein